MSNNKRKMLEQRVYEQLCETVPSKEMIKKIKDVIRLHLKDHQTTLIIAMFSTIRVQLLKEANK